MQHDYFTPVEETRSFVEEVLNNDKAACFVADEGGAILGFAAVFEKNTPDIACLRQLSYACLLDLCVLPDNRKQGIATRLIQAVKDWAKERRLHHVQLTVFEENQQAIKLYEQCSFQSAIRIMRLVL
jgi:Acetyltransferases